MLCPLRAVSSLSYLLALHCGLGDLRVHAKPEFRVPRQGNPARSLRESGVFTVQKNSWAVVGFAGNPSQLWFLSPRGQKSLAISSSVETPYR